MSANDLAKLLKGANVTINIQGGTGNTQYNGPTQINHSAAPKCKPRPICGYCGHEIAAGTRYNRHFGGGGTHWECEHRFIEERKQRKLGSLRAAYRIIDDDDDETETPRQIETPRPEPVTRVVLVRDDPAKYAHLPRPYYIPLVERTIIIDDPSETDALMPG